MTYRSIAPRNVARSVANFCGCFWVVWIQLAAFALLRRSTAISDETNQCTCKKVKKSCFENVCKIFHSHSIIIHLYATWWREWIVMDHWVFNSNCQAQLIYSRVIWPLTENPGGDGLRAQWLASRKSVIDDDMPLIFYLQQTFYSCLQWYEEINFYF